jgi:serine/threonine protein kinase
MSHHHHQKQVDDFTKRTFFNKYRPLKKLGEGSFGKIYSAVNINNEQKFALKMEYKEAPQNLLESEAYILCYLKGYGIPQVKSYGFSGEFNILVMELLGKSLEDIFQSQQKKFTLKTVCMIGIQMLDRLEFIHSKNIIHRDIKPDNFVLGLDNKSHIIYILDFGLSKKFRSSRTHQHIKFSVNKKLTGTARYASINALRGCEQSRRDDLEAIGYVLMYFLRGSLPWQGLHVNKGEDRYKKILLKKKGTSAEELCKTFPNEFAEYINYTRNLEFEADPDYKFLRGLLTTVLEKQKCEFDFYYDWLTEKPNITDEIAVERYIKNNPNISLELPNEEKKEKEEENKIDENEKENNMNMEKYSGLQTDITTEQSKTSYSKEVNKTDGDVNKQKKEESDEKNINIDLKKGSKSKDKKNKKCIIW